MKIARLATDLRPAVKTPTRPGHFGPRSREDPHNHPH
jgi:hypothetical protein